MVPSDYSIPVWVGHLPLKNEDLLARAAAYLRALTREDKIAVLYDDDGDGLSAAASVVAGITRLRGRAPDVVRPFAHSNAYIEDDLPAQLKRESITKLISVDKVVDQKGLAFMEALAEVAPVLMIDHHKVYAEMNSPRFLMVKPQLVWETESSSFPSAMLAYTLVSLVLDLSDRDWVPCIGIVSDSAYPRWQNFVDASAKKWALLSAPDGDPFKGPFGILSYIIYCTNILSPRQMGELLGLLAEAEHPDEVLNSGFRTLTGIIDAEVEEWMARLKTEIEIVPELELVIAKVRPRHAIKSLLINKLSHELYPNQTVLLLQELGQERVLVSARRQDFKVAMNALMEKAIVGLPLATGGGHIPASAASIRKEDEPVFLANVKRLLAAHACDNK